MCAVVNVSGDTYGSYAFAKGAPEVIRGMLAENDDVLRLYDAAAALYASSGYRVLALAGAFNQ